MGKRYANPPIVEAVCEFRLTSDTPWDLTIPGLLYEKVKATFPQKEQRVIQEVELTQGLESFQQQIRTSDRVLLFKKDRTMLIQLGSRLLVINALKPYPTWEGFKPHVKMAWEAVQEAVEVKGLERIGLRYINRIELPAQRMELAEFFEFYPFVGQRLPQEMASFLVGAVFSYADDRDRCRVQLAPIIGPEDKSAFMLDIDYFLNRPRAVEVSNALDWLEEAHGRVEELFEGCITDRLREIFQEVK
ncbi:MAG: hypothetical protein KatS3mg023_3244 [Armatimonadota bacterium]|nr:MAG: hypothetical protein KatS3mg023_3244 [Armatimonadota bacterium]